MKSKLNFYGLVIGTALSLGVCNIAKADGAAASATPAPTPAGPVVTFTGGIDTYYLYNTAAANQHSDGIVAPQTADPAGRAFDASDNTFRVGLAKFSVDAKEGKALGHIDLIYGQTADIIGTGATTSSGLTPSALALESAYVSYTPNAKWAFTMGKFATPIGFEVIESWSNLNYSRSFIYWDTIPVVHSGLKAAYTISDKYSVLAMVANSGWNDEHSTSQFKDGLVQFTGNPSGKFGFVASVLGGNRTGAVHTTQDVGDLNVNVNPTSAFYLGLDLTYGQLSVPDVTVDATKSDIQPYQGVAFYTSYQLSSAFKLAGRLERLNDKDGAAGTGAAYVQEGTLTLAYSVGKFLPRLEYRYDEGRDGANNLLDTQRTYTLSTAYTF
jgi:hypothetical protein